jgi:hypothetical protein
VAAALNLLRNQANSVVIAYLQGVAMEVFEPAKKNPFSSLLEWLVDGYWPVADHRDDLPVTVQSPQRVYTLRRLLAVGDVADIHLATADSELRSGADTPYLLKASRVSQGQILLDNERKALAKLLSKAGDTTYRRYLPSLVEDFAGRDRPEQRVNVFRYEPGFRTLGEVNAQHPALDGRHLGWIFNRLLTVLGFIHRQDTIHGAVLPCHLMIHAAGHGLQLVGWGQSVAIGQRIQTVPTRYKDWYPPEVLKKQPACAATDLFLAARCMVYLAGGDPLANGMPAAVPLPMQRFFATCLLERPRTRPDDAWTLLDDFDELLQELYGPPKFHPLTLT